MTIKYKIKVHAWDINVKIKQDKKQKVLQYMRWIYLTDSGLGGWQGGMLSRCCHLCGALALLAIVLKDILLINYHWIGNIQIPWIRVSSCHSHILAQRWWVKKGRSDSEASQSYTYADLLFSFLR